MTDRSHLLHELDDVLVSVRRMVQHPAFRQRMFGGPYEGTQLATLRVLRSIQRCGGDPCVGDIAQDLAIAPSTASRLVDRAVSLGYAVRDSGTDDRRQVRLGLTPAGEEVLERLNARRREILGELTDEWTQSDLAELTQRLSRLLDDFERFRGAG